MIVVDRAAWIMTYRAMDLNLQTHCGRNTRWGFNQVARGGRWRNTLVQYECSAGRGVARQSGCNRPRRLQLQFEECVLLLVAKRHSPVSWRQWRFGDRASFAPFS